ncbi:MAG: hypothetical protein ABEJ89_04700 [Haloarculaceae archaeon]
MAHVPERPEQYVCENCHVVHAGTPIHEAGNGHTFEPPEQCGACGETSFIEIEEWTHHHM